MGVLFIVLCVFFVLILKYQIRIASWYRYYFIIKNLRQLPGPPSKNFLIGNISPLHDTQENFFKVVRKWGKEYYPIYQTHVLHIATANIVNPYDFETVLSSMKHIRKNPIYAIMKSWLGTGLLTSNHRKWQTRRKILTPSFHFNILQEFLKTFVEETDKLVEGLKKECNQPYIKINDHINTFTLNTIGETAMGTGFNTETDSGKEYKKAISEIAEIYIYRLFRPWWLYKTLYFFNRRYYKERRVVKTLHRFTEEIIAKRKENFHPVIIDEEFSFTKKKRLAMLDMLLTVKEAEGGIDDEGIREEVDTFMFEGFDTTTAALCFTLMLIACHPNVQERIVEEMEQVFEESDVDFKALQELKYLERCIKEAIRLYPSVPFIGRVLGEDITTHSGHQLKAGSLVHLHIYDLHHNPNVFPDPEKFDPDRFLPENCQNRHNFAYVPFSAGPRNCIGQKFAMLEMKTVLCGILSEFRLEAVDTPSTIVLIVDMVLRTKDSIRVKFVPRDEKIIRRKCQV